MEVRRFVIVGAGIFGVTTALSLRRRGHAVTLLDPGPLPHPLAASTDISKVVRMEYGADEVYMALGERAIAGWRQWNETLCKGTFHEVGLLLLRRSEMEPSSYEYDSYELLRSRGHQPERLTPALLRARFPAWDQGSIRDGFYHGQGGFAEASRTVECLLHEARRTGVQVCPAARVTELLSRGDRVAGVLTADGRRHLADEVIVTAGSWTGKLLPHLQEDLRPVAQPIFHLMPADPAPYQASRFPVFCDDISRLGYYGFPVNPAGIVKIAHHGAGTPMDPDVTDRTATAEQEAHLRDYLRGCLPGLAGAPLVATRLCLYCDTWDGNFFIDRDPQREGLTIAAGGSGHAFKFAPVLGDLIADVAQDLRQPEDGTLRERFCYRRGSPGTAGREAARSKEPQGPPKS